MEKFQNQALLIVNTASKCGFTPQFSELEHLYKTYKDQGFSVLGFPCNQFMSQEPGDELEIQSFCKLTYGVSFPMFAKVDVKGENALPLFTFLTEQAPGVLGSKAVKWNFTKFLVSKDGQVVKRYAPQTKPAEIEEDIKKLL
ncbi:glutathione peroxidase [Peribacillus deserti]|uniref:Glutathione peroxidase n=2 Tax=Peribacillus deserti TaxID=673318 RepID=A0A2N5M245_9BACI|nr:glutathione peroxidase [Peribacillus deserti]